MKKKKRQDQPEERRQERVELNLLADEEPGRGALAKARRGCSLPFLGGVFVLVTIEGLRAVLG